MGHRRVAEERADAAGVPGTGGALPTLRTARLALRPFAPGDAPVVTRLVGAREVADTTINIPHPYDEGMAEGWIATHAAAWAEGRSLTLAITSDEEGLVGAITLRVNGKHRRGELGYWIGTPYWNRGYATEAAEAMIELGFGALSLHRIQARHFTRNPASGRVLEKLGMRPEGVQRQSVLAHDRYEDVAMWAVLRQERAARGSSAGASGRGSA